MEERFLAFLDMFFKIAGWVVAIGFVHVALRFAEALEKGIL